MVPAASLPSIPVADAGPDSVVISSHLDTGLVCCCHHHFQEKGFIQTYQQTCNKAMEEQEHLLTLYNSQKVEFKISLQTWDELVTGKVGGRVFSPHPTPV